VVHTLGLGLIFFFYYISLVAATNAEARAATITADELPRSSRNWNFIVKLKPEVISFSF